MDSKLKKKEKNTDDLLSYIMQDNENQDKVVKSELKPTVFNLIEVPYYETNRFKDTIEISNDQKNCMFHLELVRINAPVILSFFLLPSSSANISDCNIYLRTLRIHFYITSSRGKGRGWVSRK